MNGKLTSAFRSKGVRLLFILVVFAEFSRNDATECPEVKNKEENMFVINSMCYHFIATPDVQVTFASAEPDCVSRGGHLVTIKDNNTQSELISALEHKADSHTVLIGLRREGDVWKWVTGETLMYSNWESASTCRNCDCAKLKLSEGGVWEMFNCQSSDWFTAYVCEYDTTKSSATNMHPVKWSFLSVLSTLTAAIVVILCH